MTINEMRITDYNYKPSQQYACGFCGKQRDVDIMISIRGEIPLEMYRNWLNNGRGQPPLYKGEHGNFTVIYICEHCGDEIVNTYGCEVEKLNTDMIRGLDIEKQSWTFVRESLT